MRHPLFSALIFGLPIWVASPALAQQDCAATLLETGPTFTTGPDCTISWIDHNQIQTLTWRAVQDDFETATLRQTLDSATLTSSHLPELIDIDRDGWLDLVTFTPAGMVNGIFDTFLFEPAGGFYRQGQSLFGHSLTRDRDGYLIVASRNGAGTILRFFTVEDQAVTFAFEIDPFAIDPVNPDGGFACDVSATSSGGTMQDDLGLIGAVPDNPELLRHYCEIEPDPTRERRDTDLTEDRATTDRVPAGTVFYCRLAGGTHSVTISQRPEGMRYAYGPVARDPELVLDQPVQEVAILPTDGAGPGHSAQISFNNAAYTYTVFSRNDTPADRSDKAGVVRGLRVTKDGDLAHPVFTKDCLPDHAYDAIATIDPQ